MAWIFQQCKDPYGYCIRQYSVFGLSIITFVVCIFSCYKTFKKQTHYSFELIPLFINAAATLALICIQSQFQQQNIYLIMEVVEIYSYSLLAYSYVGLYLIGTKRISKQQFRKIKIGFIIFSIMVMATIILLIILQMLNLIKCKETHGLGNLILFVLQIPIYLITFRFVVKTKHQIHLQEEQTLKSEQNEHPPMQLLGIEDEYIKIRYNQANMVLVTFTISILLHIATIVMFFSENTGCSDNYLQTANAYQIVMFSLFDLAALIPHIAIPIILYFIPAWHHLQRESVIIQPKKVTRSQFKQSKDNFLQSQFQSNKIQNMVRKKSQKKK